MGICGIDTAGDLHVAVLEHMIYVCLHRDQTVLAIFKM